MLIAAFRGWNDGGQGASLAGALPRASLGARSSSPRSTPRTSTTSRRRGRTSRSPTGYTRRIDWPENAFLPRPLPGAGRDAIILLGVEPNLRWRTFTELVVGLARDFEVELVSRSARCSPTCRTRGRRRSPAARPIPTLIEQLGLQASRYEGPTGIVGVLHDACRARRPPVGEPLGGGAALRLADAVAAGGARRSCDRLGDLLDVPTSTRPSSSEAADAYAQQVSEAVATDEETAAYVDELERRVDELVDEGDLPSGESLAAELTRFLRERENDERRRRRRPRAVADPR